MIGFFARPGKTLGKTDLEAFARILNQSRIRGKHATGIAWNAADGSQGVFRSTVLHETLAQLPGLLLRNPTMLIGHTRYATSGDWRVPENNQPVSAAGMVLALNGVIDAGTKTEFEKRWQVRCHADNDAEIFLRRIESGESATKFAKRIKGSLSCCWIDQRTDNPKGYAIRNARRPLWKHETDTRTAFASTADIFARSNINGAEPLPPNQLWQTD